MARQKVTTFLWFNDNAEEAAGFYVSLFPDSRINRVVPGPEGKPFVIEFQLAGVDFLALNGGPHFQFNEAISLSVDCEDQAEVDRLWEKFTAGGASSQCCWLKDRYGLSWQIVPSILPEMMAHPDPAVRQRVMGALMGMTKPDIAQLRRAFDGKND